MPFKQMLAAMLARIPGAQGAIIADWEGEAVDQAGTLDEYDLKILGAHQCVILNNLQQVVERLGEDDQLKEVVITTERGQILILPVTRDYFLVLALHRNDMLGKALFEARRCLRALYEEIA
ncbi:MAG: roadblock/LC7 domain-containing protein [Desulfuromonadales bacterium]|nr:roadblock/LC7 domain-containing protein [Desulfuromonadales bacterium]